MAAEKNIQIISNESNQVFEIESGDAHPAVKPETTAEKMQAKEKLEASFGQQGPDATNNELARNDGSLIHTADAVLHDAHAGAAPASDAEEMEKA